MSLTFTCCWRAGLLSCGSAFAVWEPNLDAERAVEPTAPRWCASRAAARASSLARTLQQPRAASAKCLWPGVTQTLSAWLNTVRAL